jgi:uncharacterized protein YpuA (DUF1002 family)
MDALLIRFFIRCNSKREDGKMDNQFFKNVEKKTGVNMKDIFELANSLQNANFKDEQTVRGVVKRVAQIANRKVPKELEDQIVKMITKNGKQLDFNTIANMLNNNKK